MDSPGPASDLVAPVDAPKRTRKFGTGKGRNLILDPNWDKAMETDEELKELFGPDYCGIE